MAIYEGARGLPFASRPRVDGDTPVRRRRIRLAIRSGGRSGPVGAILGGIVVLFLLAFFSLAQSVRVSATSYDIDRMAAQRDRLLAQERDLGTNLSRLGSEPAIRKLALDAGLGQLDAPIVLPAR